MKLTKKLQRNDGSENEKKDQQLKMNEIQELDQWSDKIQQQSLMVQQVVNNNNNMINKSQGKNILESESIEGPEIRMDLINRNFRGKSKLTPSEQQKKEEEMKEDSRVNNKKVQKYEINQQLINQIIHHKLNQIHKKKDTFDIDQIQHSIIQKSYSFKSQANLFLDSIRRTDIKSYLHSRNTHTSKEDNQNTINNNQEVQQIRQMKDHSELKHQQQRELNLWNQLQLIRQHI